MQPKIIHDVCKDYENISLEIVLKSGDPHPKIKCPWFRIFLPEYCESSGCDARAEIDCLLINHIRLQHNGVSPKDYVSFIDEDKVNWSIIDHGVLDNIPKAPCWFFKLKRQE